MRLPTWTSTGWVTFSLSPNVFGLVAFFCLASGEVGSGLARHSVPGSISKPPRASCKMFKQFSCQPCRRARFSERIGPISRPGGLIAAGHWRPASIDPRMVARWERAGQRGARRAGIERAGGRGEAAERDKPAGECVALPASMAKIAICNVFAFSTCACFPVLQISWFWSLPCHWLPASSGPEKRRIQACVAFFSPRPTNRQR